MACETAHALKVDGPQGAPAWPRIRARLEREVAPAAFEAFLARLACVHEAPGALRLSVPTDFLRHHVRDVYGARITAIAAAEMGGPVQVTFATRLIAGPPAPTLRVVPRAAVVVPDAPDVVAAPAPQAEVCREELKAPRLQRAPIASPPLTAAPEAVPEPVQAVVEAPADPVPPVAAPVVQVADPLRGVPPLFRPHPDMTAERLITPASCRLAHASILPASRARLGSGGVLVVGAPGSGKTHLLHAAAHMLRAPVFSARGLVGRMRGRRVDDIAGLLRRWGALLCDDVDSYVLRADREIFARALDAAREAHVPVLCASGRHLAGLEHFGEALQSRLSEALCVTLGPLDADARRDLLGRHIGDLRAAQPDFALPPDVFALLVQSDMPARGLIGLLRKIAAAQGVGEPVDGATVAAWMEQQGHVAPALRVTLVRILRLVAEDYGVSVSDIKSDRRTNAIIRPRQVCAYLAKALTPLSLPQVGAHMGRDHSTILHSVRRIEEERGADPDLDARLARLEAALAGGAE